MNQIIVITNTEPLPSLRERLCKGQSEFTCVSPQSFIPGDDPVFPGTLSTGEREKLRDDQIPLLDLGDGPGNLIVPGAIVAPSATIESLCLIELGAVIGENVRIGPGCVIETGAVIGTGASIGAFSTIGTGAVIAKGVTLSAHQRVRTGECVVTNRGLKKVLANGRWIRSEKP